MDIEHYARRYRHFYLCEVPALLRQTLEASGARTCADLGCGDGSLLYALQAAGLLEGRQVHALDLSVERIERVRQISPEFHCHVASATDLGVLEAGSLDFIISTQVIEHVEDDGRMVREIARVLAPGGRGYLSTVFKKPYAWYFRRCNGHWRLDPTHLREYTADAQLLDLFARQGLTVEATAKTLIRYPLIDPVLRVLRASPHVFARPSMRTLRRLRMPICGYYNWEIVFCKGEGPPR